MLQVTTAALDRLVTKLARRKTADESTLRFACKPQGGWKLHLDNRQPDDEMFVHEGKTVLVLSDEVSKTLSHLRLDVINTASGPRLKLRSKGQDGTATSSAR